MKHPLQQIAIIHPGSLGDLVIAAYAVNAIRQAFPDAKIDAFTRFDVWSLFGLLDSWTDIETSGLHRLFSGIDQKVIGNIDIVVTWMGSKDKVFLENLAQSTGAKIIAGSPNPPEKVRAIDHVIGIIKNEDRHFFPKATNIAGPHFIHFHPKPESETGLKNYLEEIKIGDPSKLLVVHPGSGTRSKCWPPKNFAEIINWWKSTGAPVLLLEGPADADAIKSIRDMATRVPVLTNPSLDLLATLLSKCGAYVGNDSGVTHLAAAVGAKTVAIFGPTDPEVWGPCGPNVTIVKGNADCAPCPPETRRQCKHLKCLDEVTVKDVKDVIR